MTLLETCQKLRHSAWHWHGKLQENSPSVSQKQPLSPVSFLLSLFFLCFFVTLQLGCTSCNPGSLYSFHSKNEFVVALQLPAHCVALVRLRSLFCFGHRENRNYLTRFNIQLKVSFRMHCTMCMHYYICMQQLCVVKVCQDVMPRQLF